jgi:predicted nucleic acid-binding protein
MCLPTQTSPEGADQNVVGALRLRGALDQGALVEALHLVMRRHDALRTHFVHAADGTWQQVTLTAHLMTALHAQWLHCFMRCHHARRRHFANLADGTWQQVTLTAYLAHSLHAAHGTLQQAALAAYLMTAFPT